MKKLLLFLTIAGLLAFGAGQAFARASAMKSVTVVMHDPGCHWFSVGGKLLTTYSVKGPVKLNNFDEAALRVAGPRGVKIEPIGKPLVLAKGTYRITMVGQAPDDNHLKLVVR